jgi:hypothetical protein
MTSKTGYDPLFDYLRTTLSPTSLITSEDDAEHLQEDLDKLAQWREDWFMQFHPAKCTVLTVTNKRNPIVTEYTIRGQLLVAVTSARYLGVTITDKVN